jgi:hypothetical protein
MIIYSTRTNNMRENTTSPNVLRPRFQPAQLLGVTRTLSGVVRSREEKFLLLVLPQNRVLDGTQSVEGLSRKAVRVPDGEETAVVVGPSP